LRRVLTPRRGISDTEKLAAGLLLIATLAALIWANVGGGTHYTNFWNSPVLVQVGQFRLELDLRQVVNEALMTVFFFVVGLEVKKEFALGELNIWSRAVVPMSAAAAGLAVPAAIYLLLNHEGQAAHAWGVVISSDTAFVLGALAIVGPRAPGHLRVFLLALAVVDDIGALAVIAIFYTEELRPIPLVIAAIGLLLIALVRFVRVGQGPAYLVLSIISWAALYASGVQPTLAGVAIALLIPVFAPRRSEVERTAELGRAFRQSPNPAYARAAARGLRDSLSVNDRLYSAYTPYVSFIILPIFALANAGVALSPQLLERAVASPITWGIVSGLVAGKLIGITAMTALIRALRIGRLAPGLTGGRIAGGAALAGIGFTISLFIIDLAISDPTLQAEARIGVLAASAIAFVLGAVIFRVLDWAHPPGQMSMFLVRPVDPQRDHIRGPIDAPLTIVEYGDFECPFCSRATGSVDEVLAHFGDEVRYIWRHLPLIRYHKHALHAARASEAASLQNGFFDYGQVLFANQEHLEMDDLLSYAERAGMDVNRFETDFMSPRVVARVNDDAIDAETMDVHGTPTFFIQGRRHIGPWDSRTLIRELTAARDSLAGTVASRQAAPRAD
jgi:Na+/H+ antiporter NhaA